MQSNNHKTVCCRGLSLALSFSFQLAFVDSPLERMFISCAITFSLQGREWYHDEEILLRDYLMLLIHYTKRQGNAPINRCTHQCLIYFQPFAGVLNQLVIWKIAWNAQVNECFKSKDKSDYFASSVLSKRMVEKCSIAQRTQIRQDEGEETLEQKLALGFIFIYILFVSLNSNFCRMGYVLILIFWMKK